MTHLSTLLLASPTSSSDIKLTFHDIFTLQDTAFFPRPMAALIFICPSAVYNRARGAEEASMPVYTGSGPDEPVVWIKQTIGHACGLMALIHALANMPRAEEYTPPDSLMGRILHEAIPLTPEPRADVLYNSAELERAHASAASRGDTVPPADLEQDFHHFITFVKAKDGHLWELNGGMMGPVDRGQLADDEDALSERALDLGINSILRSNDWLVDAFSVVGVVVEDHGQD
jgi:ubiquitin carboxyl-terminal hydrolase L3